MDENENGESGEVESIDEVMDGLRCEWRLSPDLSSCHAQYLETVVCVTDHHETWKRRERELKQRSTRSLFLIG